jgi:uncharacterized protein YecE (DUF72 family)
MRAASGKKAAISIGTSGYVYRHWRGGVFYPAGLRHQDELEFYAREFPTVELNNSFYRLPTLEAFESWRRRTPDDFIFAVKASRFITHMKRLKDCGDSIKLLFERMKGLGPKLGPILFQMPPKSNPNIARMAEFLNLLPRGPEYVFEFRNEKWFDDEVFALLKKHRVALCVAVSPQIPEPRIVVTAPFTYLRMHGGLGKDANFTSRELRHWAGVIEEFRRQRIKSYVYFNNDWQGFAIHNARELRTLLAASEIRKRSAS